MCSKRVKRKRQCVLSGTVKENAEALVVATKEIGLEVNADKTNTWLCLENRLQN